MIFCTKCGAPVPDGQTFCTRCGTPVAPAHSAPPQYQAAPAQRPPQQGGMLAGMGLPPAIAALLTPLGIAPLIATLLCWIGWFALPGPTVTISAFQMGANATSSTLWGALGLAGDTNGGLGNGSAGFIGVIVVLCLLTPFAVPFIPGAFAKIARFLYLAPLLGFVAGWLAIEHTLSQFQSAFDAALVGGAGDIAVNTSWGIGTYFVVLMSLVVAACAVLPIFMPQLSAARFSAPHAARAAAPPPAYAPPAAYAPPPPPPVAYAPPPPAPPVVHAPPHVAHVQPTAFCTSCGKPRTAGTQFCTSCGARFAS